MVEWRGKTYSILKRRKFSCVRRELDSTQTNQLDKDVDRKRETRILGGELPLKDVIMRESTFKLIMATDETQRERPESDGNEQGRRCQEGE